MVELFKQQIWYIQLGTKKALWLLQDFPLFN